MQYVRFGSLDFQVSRLCFGGAAISGEGAGYGFGAIDEAQSIRLLHAAVDAGINCFDSAPVYGFGFSEKRIGKAFRGMRDRIFLVSKGGITWDQNKRIRRDNRPATIRSMLENSLRDLQTDYLDLYMLHWPDDFVPLHETMGELKKIQQEGKVRSIGLCNFDSAGLKQVQEVCPVSVVQNEFNLFQRSAQTDLFPSLQRQGLGFMSWGTLDKGILSGRVTPARKYDPYDARSWAPWWKKEDRTWKFEAMNQLQLLLAENGHTSLELALGFVMSFREVSTAICGMRSLEQLRSAVQALEHLPSAEIISAAIQRTSRTPLHP